MTATPRRRPPLVRVINGVGAGLSAIGLKSPSFAVKDLKRAAEKVASHSDYGSDSYLPGLEALTYSIEHEAKLNQLGRFVLHRQIVNALAGRLTIVAWEKANPEAAKAEIKAPLIIMGLPRTGTTILYEMLAADPRARAPLTWECRDYALAHQVTDAESDPRIQKLGEQMAQVDKMMPGFTAIHHFGPMIPTECIGLTLLDLSSEQFGALAWLPTYRKDWLLKTDFTSAYEWHQRGLRYLQSTQPEKSWTLKTPMHAGYLPALFAAYPDAQLIWPHRDPMRVIASVASLYDVSRGGWSDHVDTDAYAPEDARYYLELVARGTAFRAANPQLESQFCDVSFNEFMDDPMTQVDRIYSHFGRALPPEMRATIADYIASRPQDKYGTHKYSPEQFGFTDAEYGPLYADYGNRFAAYLGVRAKASQKRMA